MKLDSSHYGSRKESRNIRGFFCLFLFFNTIVMTITEKSEYCFYSMAYKLVGQEVEEGNIP